MRDEIPSRKAVEGVDEQTVADTVLVVETLAALAGPPDEFETPRERRSWGLISSPTSIRH